MEDLHDEMTWYSTKLLPCQKEVFKAEGSASPSVELRPNWAMHPARAAPARFLS